MDAANLQLEIMRELGEMRNLMSLGQIDTSQRLARLESILTPNPGQPSLLQDHEERLRSVEKFRYWLAGIVSFISVAWEYFLPSSAPTLLKLEKLVRLAMR